MSKALNRYKEVITLVFHTEEPIGYLHLTAIIRDALPDEHIEVTGHTIIDTERIVTNRRMVGT